MSAATCSPVRRLQTIGSFEAVTSTNVHCQSERFIRAASRAEARNDPIITYYASGLNVTFASFISGIRTGDDVARFDG